MTMLRSRIFAAKRVFDVLPDIEAPKPSRPFAFPQRDPNRALNYRVKAAANSAEIFLYDVIGQNFWGEGISAKQIADDLKKLGSVKTIDLHINSDGGDVFEGRAIFNQLAQHPARIVVHVDGIAASIASIIAMAGDEIRVGDGAFMMIHNAWGVAIGDANDLRRTADVMESVSATLQQTYVARTGNKPADVKQWMDDETWMDAEDCVKRGFADVLDEPVRMAAMISDPGRFRKMPAALLPKRSAAITRLAALKK